MVEIFWEPLESSILQITFIQGDIIKCFVKHPECHYETDIFCCEFELTPNENWFNNEENKDEGTCSYEDFLAYVFDSVFLTLNKYEFEEGCLLNKNIGPLFMEIGVQTDISEDLTENRFKLTIDWDGHKIGKLSFTIF